MSEERFARLEATQAELVAGQKRLEIGQEELRADVSVLKADVAVLKTDVAVLKTDVIGLRADVRDLGNHMRILHEEVIANIKAVGDPREFLLRQMRVGDAEIRQEVDLRIQPIELAVRSHSAELERLKRAGPRGGR